MNWKSLAYSLVRLMIVCACVGNLTYFVFQVYILPLSIKEGHFAALKTLNLVCIAFAAFYFILSKWIAAAIQIQHQESSEQPSIER
jgi:phage shock protein PspC (stress-responsive transcriptional regulator)